MGMVFWDSACATPPAAPYGCNRAGGVVQTAVECADSRGGKFADRASPFTTGSEKHFVVPPALVVRQQQLPRGFSTSARLAI